MGPGHWLFVDPLATFGDHGLPRRGSFGLTVEDQIPEDGDTDHRLILTAGHLLENVPDGAIVSCAPPGPEPATADGHRCGVVRRRVPLTFLPDIVVDAAVIKPDGGVECSNAMHCGQPVGIRDLWVLDEDEIVNVRKQGACTGETTGELLPVRADHYMEGVNARYSAGWWAYGRDGVPFAAKGDSGSILVDDDRNIVGMVVGIDRDRDGGGDGYVHGIKQIFSALRIALP